MKLFIATDSTELIDLIDSNKEHFPTHDILFHLVDDNNASKINKVFNTHRFHLCLSFFKAEKHKNFTLDNSIFNSVNHYITSEDKSALELQYKDNAIANKLIQLPSIVNKTTSYFNVFLPIEKCVSFSGELKDIQDIKRIDILGKHLYHVSLIYSSFIHPYYNISYVDTSGYTDILEMLKILE